MRCARTKGASVLTCSHSLRHFLTNERNRTLAIKRGEGQRLIPLEDLRERERVGFEAIDTLAADQIYERRWALALLDEVLARLGDEYRAAGPASVGLFAPAALAGGLSALLTK